MKYLNVRAKLIKFFQEDIDINLCELGLGNDFLDRTLKAEARAEKTR